MTYKHDSLAEYRHCEKCGAGLSSLVIGGIGDWKRAILCTRCMHVKRNLPYQTVILPLAAEKHGCSESHVRAADEASQEEYEEVLLADRVRPDLPAVPSCARWLARREGRT